MTKKTTWDEQQELYDKSPLSHLHPASEDWRRMQPPPYGNFRPGTLNQLRDMVHSLAREKGWHQDRDISNPHVLGSMLALIHSEVSEALEDVRKGSRALKFYYAGVDNPWTVDEQPKNPAEAKPIGLPSELADIIIRTLDLCGALGIDIEQAVEVKHAYNCTRSHRHGGKAL